MLTSEHPEPQYVLASASTITPQPRVLSQEDEQLLKFFIGLRLLGDARRERYLTYLQHLRDTAEPPKDHTH